MVFIWAIAYYLTITFRLHSPVPLEYWNPAAYLILALSYQILTVFAAFMLTPFDHLAKVLIILTLVIIVFKAGPLYLIWTNDIPWINSIILRLLCLYSKKRINCGKTLQNLDRNICER